MTTKVVILNEGPGDIILKRINPNTGDLLSELRLVPGAFTRQGEYVHPLVTLAIEEASRV